MAKFEIGDKIALDYDCSLNNNSIFRDASTRMLLEYLKSHENVFTVERVKLSTVLGGGFVYLKELKDYFYAMRFKPFEASSFNAIEQDLESLLND